MARMKEANLQKLISTFSETGHTFSSAYFLTLYLNAGLTWNDEMEDLLLRIFLRTGSLSFENLKLQVLKRYRKISPVVNFIFGSRFFAQKRYSLSSQLLNTIPPDHPLAAEKFFFMGASYGLNAKYKQAMISYKKCRKYADQQEEDADTDALKVYFAFIGESCKIHQGRLLYEQKKYRDSLRVYKRIPKTSYLWPYILLEKAWVYYKLKNYNRVLGLLATYKSPVMENYFFPEGDYLMALSYFRMCYWSDIKWIFDKYKVQSGKAKKLKKTLLRHRSSDTWFFKQMVKSIKRKPDRRRPFIEGLMIQIRKKMKSNRDLAAWIRIKKEISKIKQVKNALIRDRLVRALKNNLALRTKYLNYYIKEQMFRFLNQMNRFSEEMLVINVESASSAKLEFFTKKKRTTKRTLGSLNNVKRTSRQQLYSFNGEFWADELGDYSFALKSQCLRKETR